MLTVKEIEAFPAKKMLTINQIVQAKEELGA